jgi:hypothetical protein
MGEVPKLNNSEYKPSSESFCIYRCDIYIYIYIYKNNSGLNCLKHSSFLFSILALKN